MRSHLGITNSRLALLSLITAGVLAACGGGGGDAPPPIVQVPQGARSVAASAGADVNAGNFQTLAAPVARALIGVGSDPLLDPIGNGRETPQARAHPSATALTAPARWIWAALPRVTLIGTLREQPSSVTTEPVPCLSGSATISLDDADGDQEFSAGDTLSLTALNCVVDAGLPAANGRFSMTVNVVELDASKMPTAIDVSATFDAFALEGLGSMSGGFRLWIKPETATTNRMRVSYLGTVVDEGATTVVYSLDVYGASSTVGGTFDISGGIGIDGVTYAIATGSAFSYTVGNPPNVGSLSLRDAANDAMRLTARSPTTFDLDFLPNGASTPTASLPGRLWNDYRR